MRKLAFVLGPAILFVLVVAGVAYAATIEGNAKDNYLKETCKGDTLYGRAGDDVLDANNCGRDTDVLYAGRGSDWLLANDGDARDVLYGGKGFDTCVVDRQEARSGQASGCERVLVR